MTKITVRVTKPTVKMTDSAIYAATRNIRMNNTELGIIPVGEYVDVEFKGRSQEITWDAYHDFRKNFQDKILTCIVSTGKNSRVLFNRM